MHNPINRNETVNDSNDLRKSRKSRRFPTRIIAKNDLRNPVVTQSDLRNPLISFGGGCGGLTLSKERENPIGVLSQRDSETQSPVPSPEDEICPYRPDVMADCPKCGGTRDEDCEWVAP